MATDVWTNKTVTVDHVEVKPFGNGMDVCPVCGKPSTIGKPQTNEYRMLFMTEEELADTLAHKSGSCWNCSSDSLDTCKECWLEWLKQEVE